MFGEYGEDTMSQGRLYFQAENPPPDSNHPPGGHFYAPSTKEWQRCDATLEKLISKAKTYNAYLSGLQKIIAKSPDYLDAYSHAGGAMLELDDVDQAEVWYRKGLDIALALIPKDFSGQIQWGDLDNRPFLRLHHGMILCFLRRKNFKMAAKYMADHLAWNPNDNIGVRYLLGDAYLLTGQNTKARKYLNAGSLEGYPANSYSLALLEFAAGNFIKATTALRKGFIQNQYIAERLTGRTALKQHPFWHSNSLNNVEFASNGVDDDILKLWGDTANAVDFVDWLFNCSAVLRERQELAEIHEGYTYETDFDKRGVFGNRMLLLTDSINDLSSAKLVKKVSGSRFAEIWPWEYQQP